MPGQSVWGALSSASAGALLAAAFFTLLVARFVASYLRRIAPPRAAMAAPPPPEPVPCGELTLEALRAFDGSDPSKPLYLVRAPQRGREGGRGTKRGRAAAWLHRCAGSLAARSAAQHARVVAPWRRHSACALAQRRSSARTTALAAPV
jgi:hypothetical protein